MNPVPSADLEHVLAHSRDLWTQLAGARVFITGGTGFFGCWLLESFAYACDQLHLDATISVLTRSPEAFRNKAPHLANHPAIRLIEGDVRSFAFPNDRFTHVIHAATEAVGTMQRDSPMAMLDTIVAGTRRVLDCALATGARRFLLTSSGAVYGTQPSSLTHIPETYEGSPDPSDPKSVYAEGKRLAELQCALYHREFGLECTIARCFAFVGPHLALDAHFAVGNFIADCMANRAIVIRSDGSPYRSYLYAADLAVWLWTILVRGQPCRPYNVGSGRDLTIAELARTVASALEAPEQPKVMGVPRPGVGPARYVPSVERASDELGLKDWIDLEDAIRRTAEWHRGGLRTL